LKKTKWWSYNPAMTVGHDGSCASANIVASVRII